MKQIHLKITCKSYYTNLIIRILLYEVMGQAIRAINAYLRPGQLRHTYTTNLLSHGAAPKDVQELLGHSDVSTTMNIYAHATREAKRTSARLLDKVVGTA